MGRQPGKPLRSIKPEVVKELRRKLRALPKLEEVGLSKTDVIRSLSDEIEIARKEKGYSYKKIAETLSEAGVKVSGRAVQIALTKADGEKPHGEAGAKDSSN